MYQGSIVTMSRFLKNFFGYFLVIRFILLFVHTVICAFLALVLTWTRYLGWNTDYYLMWWWGRLATLIYGVQRIRAGESNLARAIGVFVAPHSSFWDILVLSSEVKGFFVSKAEVLKWPVVGLGAKFIRTVFIDRRKGTEALTLMADAAEKLFDTGNSLLVFPEGTRSAEHMRKFKSGSFYVAFIKKRPIVPVLLYYYPHDLFVSREKKNFIIELLEQAVKLRKAKVYIEFLPIVNPLMFGSVKELKEHVFRLMEQRYQYNASRSDELFRNQG